MFGEKKIDIYEGDRSMGFTINWYSPMAYFLLFFTVIWCAFLVFWYIMAFAGSTPLIFKLIPIIHVAAGFGIGYYTLCLFFNKTYIDVDRNYLSIQHKPIPWWRGNKEFATRDIEQFYVKEKKTQSKNGTQYTYQLRAKMTDQSDKEILSLQGLEPHQAQDIEERLERFLGINDHPVKGEHARNYTADAIEKPRRQRRSFANSPLDFVYTSVEGDFTNLKNEELEIISVTQYDWKDGNSDKVFQLINEQREEHLIYLEQNKALLYAFAEKPMNLSKVGLVTFPKGDPPSSITLEGESFDFSRVNKGNGFMSSVATKIPSEQYLYISKDQKSHIRIVNNQNQITCFKGEKCDASDFENTLDLNNPPIREKEELDQRKWDEEDFV